MKIAPSMLACDFTHLADEINRINLSEADMIHQDVMDGIFVPNISFGPDIIKSMRPLTDKFFDVHLMIDRPIRYIKDYVKSGADNITFHVEAEQRIVETIEIINKFNVLASLAIKPATEIDTVLPYLDKLYMVLVMTVEPGFGGQKFMPEMMQKVESLKLEIKRRNLNTMIQVDGGINLKTVKTAADSGVDVCVAGTTVFKSNDIPQTIIELKNI